jgi:hypothetical protein
VVEDQVQERLGTSFQGHPQQRPSVGTGNQVGGVGAGLERGTSGDDRRMGREELVGAVGGFAAGVVAVERDS